MDATFFYAISPIVLIIVLLLVFRKPLIISAPITYFFTISLAYLVWDMFPRLILASSTKGLLVAVDITIIIFGAIFFLEFLKRTGIIKTIEAHIGKVSHDQRIQGIILAWFLVSFIEGTAGFGTPAAIVAPLLVAMSFPPVTAVAIALIGDSIAVVFGAAGTPIRIGFSGLDVAGVPFYAALISFFIGIIIPVLMLWIIVRTSKNKYKGAVREVVPFALWAGFVLMIPFFLSSFLGQEFPSLIGPLVGLAVIIFTTKKGFLVPKRVWKFDESRMPVASEHSNIKAYLPYVLLIAFLFAGKYVLPSFRISIIEPIFHNLNLFNPGFLFIASILVFAALYRYDFSLVRESALSSLRVIYKPLVVILFITGFVQVMMNSSLNSSGLVSMISAMAIVIQNNALAFLSPFVGALGAFVAGSATVSNLLFGQFQLEAASSIGMSAVLVLALQVVGAALGNMISLTNIVAAQATVKLNGKESEILKLTFVPALITLVLAGIIGIILFLLI